MKTYNIHFYLRWVLIGQSRPKSTDLNMRIFHYLLTEAAFRTFLPITIVKCSWHAQHFVRIMIWIYELRWGQDAIYIRSELWYNNRLCDWPKFWLLYQCLRWISEGYQLLHQFSSLFPCNINGVSCSATLSPATWYIMIHSNNWSLLILVIPFVNFDNNNAGNLWNTIVL